MTQDVDFSTLGQTDEGFEDYFGFDDFGQYTFPDGKTWIKFKIMDEGDRAKFQRMTNKDIKISKNSGDASIPTDVAKERHDLIKTSVVDWNLHTRSGPGQPMQPVGFSLSSGKVNLESWLARANPKLVDELELAIRKANPWLQADMTVEEIDKEIERLQELRAEAVKREAAK